MNRTTASIILPRKGSVKPTTPESIKVRVSIPKDVTEATRRQKINRIYDILRPEKCR